MVSGIPLLTVVSLALAAGQQTPPPPSPGLVPAPQPFRAEVQDPLLAPPPPPAVTIDTWAQARTLLQKASTDVRIAAAEVDRAEGRWRQALGTLLPNLNASAGSQYDLLNPDTPTLGQGGGSATALRSTTPSGTLSVTGSQALVDVAAWRGLSSAAANSRSAEASLSDVRRRLTLGLARGLVSVLAAERVAELNRLGLRQALERAALTQRTQQLGAATALDVARVQQDVEVARGSLIAGDEQLLLTRESLAVLLGLRGGASPSPAFKLDGLLDEVRGVCRELPWEQRPDLVAAREAAESARASRQQATAGYLPSLRASSTAFGLTTTDPGLGRLATWNIGAVLSIPLWEGGTREGLVRERRGVEEQAEARLEATRRDVEVRVAQAQRRVRIAEDLLQAATRARALAEQTDQLTRRAFEVGRGNTLELVQSAQALRQADVVLATREFELVQARLDAYLTEARCDW